MIRRLILAAALATSLVPAAHAQGAASWPQALSAMHPCFCGWIAGNFVPGLQKLWATMPQSAKDVLGQPNPDHRYEVVYFYPPPSLPASICTMDGWVIPNSNPWWPHSVAGSLQMPIDGPGSFQWLPWGPALRQYLRFSYRAGCWGEINRQI